ACRRDHALGGAHDLVHDVLLEGLLGRVRARVEDGLRVPAGRDGRLGKDDPQVGRASPIATSFSWRRNGPSAMKRRSHAKASIAPPAIACPVTAATVGIGKVKTRSMLRPEATIVRLSSWGGSVGRTYRLSAAEKTPARPAITSAPGRSR